MAFSGFHPGIDAGLFLLTLTAPGDRLHYLPNGEPCRCTPAGGVDLAEWNASHSRRWNLFRTRLKQELPGLEYFRGVEAQKRGALHDHALIRVRGILDVRRLRQLAMDAGFGHSVDLEVLDPNSRRGAEYVSKYVTKSADARDDVPWADDVVDLDTGEVTRGVVPGRYRTWSMSRGWGQSMAAVTATAAAYARLKATEASEMVWDLALSALTDHLGAQPVADDTG